MGWNLTMNYKPYYIYRWYFMGSTICYYGLGRIKAQTNGYLNAGYYLP